MSSLIVRKAVIPAAGFGTRLFPATKVVKKELDSDDIFEHKLDKNHSSKSFTMPSLHPGCIIEYKYKLKSENMNNFPTEWIFQHTIPSLWSEYNIRVPQVMKYALFYKLAHPLCIDEEKVKKNSYYGSHMEYGIKTDIKRFAMKDIPALKIEPFIKSINNYCSKLTFQLFEYYSPYPTKVKGIQNWNDVGLKLMEYSGFGGVIQSADTISSVVKEIIADCESDLEKIKAIYSYISNFILWNGVYTIYSNDLQYTLDQKKGDTGDINLLLVAMLRDAGIVSYPVILSTRSNIELYTNFPVLSQFNYVIAFAQVDSNQLLLDATNKLRPLSLLSIEALNDFGLLIKEDDVQLVQIYPTKKDESYQVINAEIDSTGSMNGFMQITSNGYSAFIVRTILSLIEGEEYINGVLNTGASQITPTSVIVNNKDEIEKNLIIRSDISSSNYAQVSEKVMYISPFIGAGELEENPFKSDTRMYPVEFAYPVEHHYAITITIPEGYSFQECPSSISEILPDDAAGYIRNITVIGNKVTILTHFYINRLFFDPSEYSEIKNFFEKVAASEKEFLIIEK